MNQRKKTKNTKQINSQSQSFELQAHQMKRLGYQINKKKFAQGSWSLSENKIYLQFLQDYKHDFRTQVQRRKSRVFYKISKLLKKRTPDQCRSHHQKLLNKHKGNIDQVIKQLIIKISESHCDDQGSKNKLQLKTTLPCSVDFTKQIKDQQKKTQSFIIEQQSFYNVELRQDFLQLNIWLDKIKQW